MLENRENYEAIASTSLLQGLQKGETWAIEALYRNAYPTVATMVKRNRGTTNDAKDLFQECLLVLIPKLRAPDFSIKVSPGAYLYAIARNLWLSQLRKSSKNPIDLILDEPDTGFQLKEIANFNASADAEDNPMFRLIKQTLEKLGEDCQRVIRMKHIYKYSHEEIMGEMGYSAEYSRLKLSKCMGQLRKKIKGDPAFNNV